MNITLSDEFLEWEWFSYHGMVNLYIYLVLRARETARKWRGRVIAPRSIVTTIERISRETGLSIQNIRTCIRKLIESKYITTEVTNNITTITLCEIVSYNDENSDANKRLTEDQQGGNNTPTGSKQGRNSRKTGPRQGGAKGAEKEGISTLSAEGPAKGICCQEVGADIAGSVDGPKKAPAAAAPAPAPGASGAGVTKDQQTSCAQAGARDVHSKYIYNYNNIISSSSTACVRTREKNGFWGFGEDADAAKPIVKEKGGAAGVPEKSEPGKMTEKQEAELWRVVQLDDNFWILTARACDVPEDKARILGGRWWAECQAREKRHADKDDFNRHLIAWIRLKSENTNSKTAKEQDHETAQQKTAGQTADRSFSESLRTRPEARRRNENTYSTRNPRRGGFLEITSNPADYSDSL
ncbi:MAG: hypothetical protein HDS67_02345 [Bacteroidales bacterium]|nr:hypothetical protein [Bacteroidales bacterium]